MRAITTIALLLICAMASMTTFAQSTASEDVNDPTTKENITQQDVDKADQTEVQKAPEKVVYKPHTNSKLEQEKGASSTSDQPYINYKGIKDPVEAKKAWAADHPEIYDKANSKLPYYRYKGIENLDEAKEAWIKDHPEEYKKSTAPIKTR